LIYDNVDFLKKYDSKKQLLKVSDFPKSLIAKKSAFSFGMFFARF